MAVGGGAGARPIASVASHLERVALSQAVLQDQPDNKPMKSRIIDQLHRGALVATVISAALLVLLVLVVPNAATMWTDRQWVSGQINKAETVEDMRQLLKFATSSTRAAEQTWRMCLYTFVVADIAMIAFLTRQVVLIRRLKREVSSG